MTKPDAFLTSLQWLTGAAIACSTVMILRPHHRAIWTFLSAPVRRGGGRIRGLLTWNNAVRIALATFLLFGAVKVIGCSINRAKTQVNPMTGMTSSSTAAKPGKTPITVDSLSVELESLAFARALVQYEEYASDSLAIWTENANDPYNLSPQAWAWLLSLIPESERRSYGGNFTEEHRTHVVRVWVEKRRNAGSSPDTIAYAWLKKVKREPDVTPEQQASYRDGVMKFYAEQLQELHDSPEGEAEKEKSAEATVMSEYIAHRWRHAFLLAVMCALILGLTMAATDRDTVFKNQTILFLVGGFVGLAAWSWALLPLIRSFGGLLDKPPAYFALTLFCLAGIIPANATKPAKK